MIARMLASLCVFVAVSVLAAMLLVLPGYHGLDAFRAELALALGLVASFGLLVQQTRQVYPVPEGYFLMKRRFSAWAWLMFTAFGLFAIRTYCWLVFFDGDEIKIVSPNNLGDLSLHLMLARYFANGVHWWPDHPEHAWVSMRYYPGIDLFQSLLNLAGADEYRALVWVGLIGAAALALALYEWGGAFTMAGFLFSGGLAGFQIFRTGVFKDYQTALAWKSLPLAIFVTQRPFLFALPAGLLLMAHWRRKFFAREAPLLLSRQLKVREDRPSRGLIPFWAEALLYTVMPLLHLFTFVFLSLLLGWWFVAYFPRASMRRHLLWLVGIALVPATWQISLMTGGFTGASMVHLKPGWMQEANQSFLGFWLLNFGLFGPLAIACWGRCAWTAAAVVLNDDEVGWAAAPPRPSGDGSELAVEAFVVPSGIIFGFLCVVMLTTWEWDNTKIMLWCYLATLPFLWERWIAPLRSAARWPVCAALFLSGFVCLVGGLGGNHGRGYDLVKRSEVDAVSFAVKDLPPEARFAAAPTYNHPLVFCGRKLAMGYEGHLYSQGLEYKDLLAELRTLMLGEAGWEQCAQRMDVRYVYWGAPEEKTFAGSTKPWEARCRRVAEGEWGKIYDLQEGAR